MQARWIHRLGPLAIALSAMACQTQTVRFTSDVEAQVSLVDATDAGGRGERLGKTPLSVKVAKTRGKLVRIDAPGAAPQYWVFNETLGERLEARVSFGKAGPSANANESHRLLLQAYQAITTRDYSLARDLATRIAEISPEVAAPHILRGLIEMQEGNEGKAISYLKRAKALDPNDRDIDTLLERIAP